MGIFLKVNYLKRSFHTVARLIIKIAIHLMGIFIKVSLPAGKNTSTIVNIFKEISSK
jgi:hypothetical protein